MTKVLAPTACVTTKARRCSNGRSGRPRGSRSSFPRETIWRATGDGERVTIQEPPSEHIPVAIVGARPCELAATRVLDRVLDGGAVPDPAYAKRRAGSFVVVAECGAPASTCFCMSMDTGPAATDGYDLALTELSGSDGNHRYLVRVGSDEGAEVLKGIAHQSAIPEDLDRRDGIIQSARDAMSRSLDTNDLPACWPATSTIRAGPRSPNAAWPVGTARWSVRPASAATFDDVSDSHGDVERNRRWRRASSSPTRFSTVARSGLHRRRATGSG